MLPRGSQMAGSSPQRAGAASAAAAAVAWLLALGLCVLGGNAAAQANRPGPAQNPAGAPGAPPAAAGAGATAASPPCSIYNLIPAGLISGFGVEGDTRTIRDRQLATEGTLWDSPLGVRLHDARSELRVDLRSPQMLQYLVLQGDNNDSYRVEGSADNRSYRTLWLAPSVEVGMGLRTRSVVLPKPETVRFLRIRGEGGDGFYSLSELRAYCKRPAVWPPALKVPPKIYGWAGIDNDIMVWLKLIGSVLGAAVLIVLMALGRNRARRRKPWKPRWWGYPGIAACGGLTGWNLYYLTRDIKWLQVTALALTVVLCLALALYDLWRPLKWRRGDSALAFIGIFAFFSWWNLGHFHFDHYVHIWEHYHYYIGAKYGPELRYARIYECTAAADMADGMRARVKKREMRDLATTNELGPSDAILNDPTICTRHFTPARWAAFREDIRFFRNHFPPKRWDESQTDHGYNGTPVWAIAGRLLADHGKLTWNKIVDIACIDSALLVLMWAASWWAFGWRVTCVGMMWWGFDFPARYYWNGGSMLRYDWLFWLLIGICLLKKRHHFGAGMALTYSTLLRIFPGFVVAALMLKALARIVRKRRLVISRSHLRFAGGCILAFAILIPASGWATGGLEAWQEFVHNSEKHLSTPLTNNMGLKTALGYDADTSAKYLRNSALHDPFSDWKDAREYYYHKRAPILYALILLFCVMLAHAGEREPDWAIACLGTGLIAMASELTCYYYGFLLAYGLLWNRHKLPAIAVALLSALTCALYLMIDWNDDHFAGMSLATSIVVVLVTALIAYGPRTQTAREREPRAAPPLRAGEPGPEPQSAE